jgi:hypothetical protein
MQEDGTIDTMSDKQRPSESKDEKIDEAEAIRRKFLLIFGKDQSPEDMVKAINAARAASIKPV